MSQDRSCPYIEYPKMMYNQNGETMTVDNGEEEEAATMVGWLTVEGYHKYLVEGGSESDNESEDPEEPKDLEDLEDSEDPEEPKEQSEPDNREDE